MNDDKNTRDKRLSRKQLLILVGGLVALLAVAGITYMYLSHMSKSAAPDVAKLTPKDTTQEASQQASDLVDGSSQDTSKTSLDKTQAQLSALEKDAKTTELKQIYGGAAIDLYEQSGDMTTARDSAIEDNDDYGTVYTAAHLAAVYEAMGDYANAAKYYGQAVQRSPKTGPRENSSYNDYRYAQQQMEKKQ